MILFINSGEKALWYFLDDRAEVDSQGSRSPTSANEFLSSLNKDVLNLVSAPRVLRAVVVDSSFKIDAGACSTSDLSSNTGSCVTGSRTMIPAFPRAGEVAYLAKDFGISSAVAVELSTKSNEPVIAKATNLRIVQLCQLL